MGVRRGAPLGGEGGAAAAAAPASVRARAAAPRRHRRRRLGRSRCARAGPRRRAAAAPTQLARALGGGGGARARAPRAWAWAGAAAAAALSVVRASRDTAARADDEDALRGLASTDMLKEMEVDSSRARSRFNCIESAALRASAALAERGCDRKKGQAANQSVTHLPCCFPWVATGHSQRHPVQQSASGPAAGGLAPPQGPGQRPAAGRETDDAVIRSYACPQSARSLARGYGTKGGTPAPTHCGKLVSYCVGHPSQPPSTPAARGPQAPRQNRPRSRVCSTVLPAAAS